MNEGLEEALREIEDHQRLAEAGVAIVPDPKFLAAFVCLERSSMGWKQQTLASFARVSLSTIQRVERGDPVSSESLDLIALALGQKPGAFTEPRVPATREEFSARVERWIEPFRHKARVDVRPLTNQSQIAKLVHATLCIVDGREQEENHREFFDALRESFGCIAMILAMEQPDTIFKVQDTQRVKRRELYNQMLDQVKAIRIETGTTALTGIYNAKTNHPALPTATVGILGFFSRQADPGAVNRKILFAPELVDLSGSIPAILSELAPEPVGSAT